MRIVREGRSFSGRERHCLFVNSGGEFFDASAISGFDFADDGRGLAVSDWDHDGDLDVWITNRNGPQIRYLENQSADDGHFIQIKLRGTKSNRDGIGARVTVRLKGEPLPIVRTLNAGDSFLSQSSKRIHFGLGDNDQIEQLEIRWPNGERQSVEIRSVDCAYAITEGDLEARRETRRDEITLNAAPIPRPPNEALTSSMCFSMIRLPANDFETLDGTRDVFVSAKAKLILVNLWASWCQPCVQELSEFAKMKQQLWDRGIDVVALNVESRSDLEKDPRQLLEQLEFPFRSGFAEESLLTRLQLLMNTIFELHEPLPLPTSFLLDRKARVVAVYKGPVSVQKLLADADKLKAKTTQEWRMATVPFPGTWIMPPRRRHLFEYAEELADLGFVAESIKYVQDNAKMFQTHPGWSRLKTKLFGGAIDQLPNTK